MNLKLSVLFDSVGALQLLSQKELPGRVAFVVARNTKNIAPVVDDFLKSRAAVLEKHGTLNEDKTRYDWLSDEHQNEGEAEMKQLLETEVEVNVTQIEVAALDSIQMPPAAMASIMWMFKE